MVLVCKKCVGSCMLAAEERLPWSRFPHTFSVRARAALEESGLEGYQVSLSDAVELDEMMGGRVEKAS